jgi:hypothetical protein
MRITGRCELSKKGCARAINGLALVDRPGDTHKRRPFRTGRAGKGFGQSYNGI